MRFGFIALFGLVFLKNQVFAQNTVDTKFIFKTWFFIEKENEFNSSTRIHAKDSLYLDFFLKEIDLNIDTLSSMNFSGDFIFLSVCQYYNDSLVNKNAITYKRESQKYGYYYSGIPVNHCEGYALAINTETGRSYRLKGFRGNDFLTFLKDIKIDHNKRMKGSKYLKPFRVRKFLKDSRIDGIDLTCLYRSLHSFKKKSAACLSKCENITVTTY